MKKIFNIVAISLAISATLGFQSCKDDDNAPVATKLQISTVDATPLSSLEFSMGSTSTMIAVLCDADWTAESSEDWCLISNHAGYGYAEKCSYIKVLTGKNMGEARTATITFRSGDKTATINVTQKGAGADPGDPFMSSFALLEQVHLGYNLGNTLDANADPLTADWFKPTDVYSWETVWGQPVTTQAIIDEIASKGFDFFRIPVTWHPHMDAQGNVDKAWMDRVEEVVNYVLNTGSYCILNVQHDTGDVWKDVVSGARKDRGGWLRADMDAYDEISPIYKTLWTNIATRFKNYDDHLIFESFNEILNPTTGWTQPSAGHQAYECIRRLHQDFVDAVRATGGNNEYRNLSLNPYSAGSNEANLNEMVVPNDKHPNHILFSIHSYDPYNFCNENGEWTKYVWDKDCEKEVDEITARVDARFQALGVPYFYGEFGAIDAGKEMAERIKYAKYMVNKFNQYHTTGLWWMGLYDRKDNTWYESEIVNAMMETYKP